MSLPDLPYRGSIMRSSPQTAFGGLNHNPSAGDGELYDMTNLSTDAYPLLAPRKRRWAEYYVTGLSGMGAQEKPYWVNSGGKFFYNGAETSLQDLTAGPKEFAAMGTKIFVFPDKAYYDTKDHSSGSMEASAGTAAAPLSGVQFQNGQYAGVYAEANTIYKSGASWSTYFKEGDAVTIHGCTDHAQNNKTAIIREIDGDYLRFYENTFTLDRNWKYVVGAKGLAGYGSWRVYRFVAGTEQRYFSFGSEPDDPANPGPQVMPANTILDWDGTDLTAYYPDGTSETITTYSVMSGVDETLTFKQYNADYTETGTAGTGQGAGTGIWITRDVPALTHVCVNENRLWGTDGKKICASKLGDPFNFNVFDGLATDSWQSETIDAGDFTACYSYLGYPLFFKENTVYKVYGDKATNFQWTHSVRLGVKSGCARSLAVAGETLFYLSPSGICAYTGGIPTVISGPLGENTRWYNAVGGSDNIKYYVSMTADTGNSPVYSLYVFDTRYRTWHREDNTQAVGFAYCGYLLMATATGVIWSIDGGAGTRESPVSWVAEFADFTRVYETSDTRSENKKGLLRLIIRCELDTGASMDVKVRYDSRGDWITARTLTSSVKQSFTIPLILRRCDHFRLKLAGTGDFKVWSIAPIRYSGSHLQEIHDPVPVT